MPTVAMPAPCVMRPDTVLVMLPGSYSRPEDFVREGFVAALRERGIAADVVLADAHVGYYRGRTIHERLRDDVMRPARAHYRNVWLVGISIGAFGAMLYADAEPQDVDGVVAIGPYLGERLQTESILAQGGLARWTSPPRADPESVDVRLWRWLQPYATGTATRPPLFLGYGRSDRFAASDVLLASALPADRVFTAEGGHDWEPWRAVWRRALDAIPLPRDASCVAR